MKPQSSQVNGKVKAESKGIVALDTSKPNFLGSTQMQNVVTIFAIIVAFLGIYINSLDQREALHKQIDFNAEAAANSAWISYREVEERFLTVSTKTELSKMNKKELDLYHLTVERLMMSADIVTYSLDKDKQWENAFAIEFQRHKDYILSEDFLREYKDQVSEFCTYRHPVHEWILRAFKSDLFAVGKISTAHAICEKHLKQEGYSDVLGEPNHA